MRNAENIRRVANAIEKEYGPEFRMVDWSAFNKDFLDDFNVCNTAACIAGHTVYEFYPDMYLDDMKSYVESLDGNEIEFLFDFKTNVDVRYFTEAREILGLTVVESANLFVTSMNVTKEDAVKFLRFVADNPDYKIPPYWNDEGNREVWNEVCPRCGK